MRSILIIWLLAFSPILSMYHLQAQKSFTALQKEYSKAQGDSAKISSLLELADYYQKEQFDSALYFYNKGLQIARKNNLIYHQAFMLLGKSRVISYQGNYEASIDTIQKALHYYRKEGDKEGTANALNSIGVNYYNLSAYDSCRHYWKKSGKLYREIGDSLGLATNYTNLGVVDYVQSRAESALDNFIKSLKIREAKNHQTGLASIYMKIALIYQNKMNEPGDAYQYLKKAFKLYTRQNDNLGQAKALVNLSNVYKHYDSLNMQRKSIDQARIIAEKIGNKRLLGTIYSNLGNIYSESKRYDKALEYYYKARDIFEALDQKRELGGNYYNLAYIFYQLEDYETAISYFDGCLDLSEDIETYALRQDALHHIAQAYAKQNQYKKAYQYHQKYAGIKDTLAEIEKEERLEELEARFAGKQKAQKIKILEKQQELKNTRLKKATNTRNFMIAIAALIFITALLMYQKYRQKVSLNKKLRERNKEVREKNKEIRNQAANMEQFNKLLVDKNELIEKQKEDIEEVSHTKDRIFSIIGHDLRSPLASIQTSLQVLKNQPNNTDKQQHMHQLMENNIVTTLNLLNNLLMWAKSQDDKLFVDFKKQSVYELAADVIEEVQSIAERKQISIELKTAQATEAVFDENMISTVLRNLLTNAIKFSPENKQVEVHLDEQSSMLKVTVKDYGIGMDSKTIKKIMAKDTYYTQPGTSKEKGSGLGLNLCVDFVKKHKGNLVIESEPGQGSEISFTLPRE